MSGVIQFSFGVTPLQVLTTGYNTGGIRAISRGVVRDGIHLAELLSMDITVSCPLRFGDLTTSSWWAIVTFIF